MTSPSQSARNFCGSRRNASSAITSSSSSDGALTGARRADRTMGDRPWRLFVARFRAEWVAVARMEPAEASALTAAPRWASVAPRAKRMGQDDKEPAVSSPSSRPASSRSAWRRPTMRRAQTAAADRNTERRALGARAGAVAAARARRASASRRLYPYRTSLDRLSGSVHDRISRPRLRAAMHVMAGAGNSPERPGHRAADALLVGAVT